MPSSTLSSACLFLLLGNDSAFLTVACGKQTEFELLLHTLGFLAFKDRNCLMLFAASFLL